MLIVTRPICTYTTVVGTISKDSFLPLPPLIASCKFYILADRVIALSVMDSPLSGCSHSISQILLRARITTLGEVEPYFCLVVKIHAFFSQFICFPARSVNA